MLHSKDYGASCDRLRVSSQDKCPLSLFAEQSIEMHPLFTEGNIETTVSHLQNTTMSHDSISAFTSATKQLDMLEE